MTLVGVALTTLVAYVNATKNIETAQASLSRQIESSNSQLERSFENQLQLLRISQAHDESRLRAEIDAQGQGAIRRMAFDDLSAVRGAVVQLSTECLRQSELTKSDQIRMLDEWTNATDELHMAYNLVSIGFASLQLDVPRGKENDAFKRFFEAQTRYKSVAARTAVRFAPHDQKFVDLLNAASAAAPRVMTTIDVDVVERTKKSQRLLALQDFATKTLKDSTDFTNKAEAVTQSMIGVIYSMGDDCSKIGESFERHLEKISEQATGSPKK